MQKKRQGLIVNARVRFTDGDDLLITSADQGDITVALQAFRKNVPDKIVVR